MLIFEISYLHALCYNIHVIFIVIITRPLEPQFIVSHRTSEFAGTALAVTMAHYKVDGFAVCLAVKTHDKDTVIVDPPLA